jgi:anti-sigma regulatory factor (Ser/Thr protein kinase)
MGIGSAGEKKAIRVPAERRYLSAIRDFIHQFTEAAGAAPAEVDSLIQAVDEAVANVIIHGYMDGPGISMLRLVYPTGQSW